LPGKPALNIKAQDRRYFTPFLSAMKSSLIFACPGALRGEEGRKKYPAINDYEAFRDAEQFQKSTADQIRWQVLGTVQIADKHFILTKIEATNRTIAE
jgi:hypothetical protein